ncbi:MAG: DnaJ domain-containing protein [SAR324 cluster bacterium]|nr:DnaJ domain-containing protein [SAR324 cluster bacterium]
MLKNKKTAEDTEEEPVIHREKLAESLKVAKEKAILRREKEKTALQAAKISASENWEKIKAIRPVQRRFVLSSEKEKFQKRLEDERKEKNGRRKTRRHRVVKNKLTQAYLLLGVEDTASPAMLKKAYREKMKQYHPDKAGKSPQKMEMANAKTIELKEAYETILKTLKGEKQSGKSSD